MKKVFFIIVLSLIAIFPSACKQKSLPPDIWKKEKMVEFLTEAQLVEAKVSTKHLPPAQNDSLYALYYEELFLYFNTSKEIWQKNLEYYRNDPEALNEIYSEVISNLTVLESTVQPGHE